jgi:hypothetical protein
MEIIEVITENKKLSFLFYDNGIFKIYHEEKEPIKVYNSIRYKDDKMLAFDEIIAAIYVFITDKICEPIGIEDVLKIEPLKESSRLKPYLRDYQINSILE